jgi:AraC-like DNA-binding protein
MLNNISIEGDVKLYTVNSYKGRNETITNRKNFGISFCHKGQITYKMNGKTFTSTKECAVIHPKNATYELFGNSEGVFTVINFDCPIPFCDEITVIPLADASIYYEEIENIRALELFPENRLKILSVLYSMLNNLSHEQIGSNSILYPAIKHIENNISDPNLTNKTLADYLNISEIYFRKLFIKQYKITPKQYVLNARIKKAKQLLCGTSMSVTAIANECGFTSVYHFCRAFKERCRKTPTDYAAAHKRFKI